MTKEDFDDLRDELVDKYYAEDAMCKSDLFDLLNDYDKLLKTASNTDYAQCQELLEECFDIIGTSKLCTKAIYHKLLRHFA